jgi:hypothetical protein
MECLGLADYSQHLGAAGVALVPLTQPADAKLSGLSYRLDDVTMQDSGPRSGAQPC